MAVADRGIRRRMTMLCSACVAAGENVEALSVTSGEAVCARHFALSLDNPAMTEKDRIEHVRRTLTREHFPAS